MHQIKKLTLQINKMKVEELSWKNWNDKNENEKTPILNLNSAIYYWNLSTDVFKVFVNEPF